MNRTALCTLGDIAPLSVHRRPIVKPFPEHLFTVHGTDAETRWEAMAGQGYHTPNDRFFVGNHTATPLVDARSWRLRLHGDGLEGPRSLTYTDLRRLPARTLDAAIECAGNGRSLFPGHDGVPWGLGGIGVARLAWGAAQGGARLAGLRPDAAEVLATGLDDPVEGHGHVRHSLPLTKALDDALIAYEMNGVPLPPDHGYPARLVVPGWVGIASIKWLGGPRGRDAALHQPVRHRGHHPVGEERVRAALARDGGPRQAPRPARPVLVGERRDRQGRGQHRRRPDMAEGLLPAGNPRLDPLARRVVPEGEGPRRAARQSGRSQWVQAAGKHALPPAGDICSTLSWRTR